jgi:ankyrin repeat protein
MLNPWQALPLPPRPSVVRYRKLAKQLVKAAQSDSIGEWAARHATRPIEEFAREKLAGSGPKLTAAQFVIARAHGFESWPKFQKHVAAMAKKGSAVERFEAAADAIVNGKIGVLKRMLREDPELIRMRSTREHRAMLLHYAAANGVEQHRQKTPKNIVRITEALLAAGAEIDATAELYGGGATTLGLAATSIYPQRAGVQEALIQLLLDHGAAIGDTARGCLWNGQGEAAKYLAERGATLTLESAAGVGRLDVVESYFADGAKVSREEMRAGFLLACAWGRDTVVEFLLDRGADPAWCRKDGQTALHWAVIGGHLETVRILLQWDPPLEAVNMHGGTVLGQTLWSAAHGGDVENYVAILDELVAAGARVPEKHVPVNSRIDAWLAKHGSFAESSWYWPGEE